MKNFRAKLSARPEVKNGRYKWYCLSRYASNYVEYFDKPKLIYPNMASRLFTAYDDKKFYTNQKCFIITSESLDLRFIHCLFTSNVLNFVFMMLGSPLGTGGYDINKSYVEQLPIMFDENIEKKLIKLADKTFELKDKLKENLAPNERLLHQQQLEAINIEIETLIYELYELTDDEIAIIEEMV